MNTNPLITACRSKNLELTELLIKNGANVNFKTKDGMTPLHYACIFPLTTKRINNTDEIDLEIVRKLIEAGADINAKDNEGCTPLSYAATLYGLELPYMLSKFLIENGADVNINTEGENNE